MRTTILGFDPGKNLGMATWKTDRQVQTQFVKYGTMGEMMAWLECAITEEHATTDKLIVVCEHPVLGIKTYPTWQSAYWLAACEGMITAAAEQVGAELHLVAPMTLKAYIAKKLSLLQDVKLTAKNIDKNKVLEYTKEVTGLSVRTSHEADALALLLYHKDELR